MGRGKLDVILATDCGSTTTKAILIERQEEEYRLVVRGEAPTTVEAPYEDVTIGVRNAFAEVEELTGRKLLGPDGQLIKPAADGRGVDGYFSTSSAGGGLQVVVVGLVRRMTAESAQRAALGAGAIVMDVIALDDRRQPHERIEQMRLLRPDMLLLSGGTDGGERRRVVMMAELIAAANPQARLGTRYRLPVIFAGNKDARDDIRSVLGEKFDLTIVDNLRPSMEEENLAPTRAAIQELFLEHVMAQAPGYSKLIPMTDADIMPTPAAVGNMMQVVAEAEGLNIVGVDIGGATTDVFSVYDGIFHRTVSANLGMSYSISQVMAEAGLDSILRWLPAELDPRAVSIRIRNKMIRPTTIPQTLEDLMVEQAVAREALRLAFEQHKALATGLKG
ncbi:MAG: glutamate mutase L, partial [Armatimonadetes bacterium]|nr:glutamate mutase L [Armatimonadota bacterium]